MQQHMCNNVDDATDFICEHPSHDVDLTDTLTRNLAAAELEQPLPPGPIWTNGAAADERPFTAIDLEYAQGVLDDARANYEGNTADWYLIAWLCAGAFEGIYVPTPTQLALRYLISRDIKIAQDQYLTAARAAVIDYTREQQG